MSEHEHTVVTDAEMVEMVRKAQERMDAAFASAKERDSRACLTCMQIGVIIGQILMIENVIEDGTPAPELHAALQGLYAKRDAALGHRNEPTVIQ